MRWWRGERLLGEGRHPEERNSPPCQRGQKEQGEVPPPWQSCGEGGPPPWWMQLGGEQGGYQGDWG